MLVYFDNDLALFVSVFHPCISTFKKKPEQSVDMSTTSFTKASFRTVVTISTRPDVKLGTCLAPTLLKAIYDDFSAFQHFLGNKSLQAGPENATVTEKRNASQRDIFVPFKFVAK